MVDLLSEVPAAAWFGVVGTLVGVVVGGAISHFSEWFRWRRNRRDRWDERRLEAYSRFLAAVLNSQRRWMFRMRTESKAELEKAVAHDLENVTTTVAEVNLVASPPVRESARQLTDALQELVNQATTHRAAKPRSLWSGYDEPALAESLDHFISQRAGFEQQVQAELDIE